jgi:hypothetical protein
MRGCLKEFEIAGRLRAEDADLEIVFTLLSRAYEFQRWVVGQVIAYIVCVGGIEVGRLVLAPCAGADHQVRIREHHTLLEQPQQDWLRVSDDVDSLPGQESHVHGEFANLCHHIRQMLESLGDAGGPCAANEHDQPPWPEFPAVGMSCCAAGKMKDSNHFAYPRSKRLEIVRHYRLDRVQGEVRNKDHWARTNYQIGGRTLSNYECEFPETDVWQSDSAGMEFAGPE